MKKAYKFICLTMIIAILCMTFAPAVMAAENGNHLALESVTLQLREDEAIKKFNALLDCWTAPTNLNETNYPDYYGGAYINGDKNLTIQVTGLTKTVIEDLSNIIDLKDVTLEVVDYSYLTLLSEKNKVAEKMYSGNTAMEIAGVGIQASTNSINIYIYDPENKLESKSINIDAISNFPNRTVIATKEKPSVCAAVEPGSVIKDRSVGFWARNADGDLGIVTAPHASIDEGETIYINGTVFGIAETPYYEGNVDAVFVRRTNSTFTPTRSISGFNFDLSTLTSVALPEGATVYSKGKETENDTGTVVERDYEATYGIVCTRATNACVSGDSGGIVAGGGNGATRYVAGIITGRTGNNTLLYVEARNILNTLDVTIY